MIIKYHLYNIKNAFSRKIGKDVSNLVSSGEINNNIKTQIKKATNEWISTVEKSVNLKANPSDVANLFCKDAVLRATFSQILRDTPESIKEYFDYFARIPGLKVVNRDFKVAKITNDVYVNNAKVDWIHDGINENIESRMTFIFRRSQLGKWCIFQLHASELPEPNPDIK